MIPFLTCFLFVLSAYCSEDTILNYQENNKFIDSKNTTLISHVITTYPKEFHTQDHVHFYDSVTGKIHSFINSADLKNLFNKSDYDGSLMRHILNAHPHIAERVPGSKELSGLFSDICQYIHCNSINKKLLYNLKLFIYAVASEESADKNIEAYQLFLKKLNKHIADAYKNGLKTFINGAHLTKIMILISVTIFDALFRSVNLIGPEVYIGYIPSVIYVIGIPFFISHYRQYKNLLEKITFLEENVSASLLNNDENV